MDLAYDVDAQEVVPLELAGSGSDDAPRYRVLDFADGRARVQRVTRSGGNYQADHRFDCPGFNAGR